MASQQQLEFAVKATNEASKVLKDVGNDVEDLGKKSSGAGGLVKGLAGSIGEVGKIAGGFVIGAGLLKLPGFFADAAKGAAEDRAATERLQQTFKNYADMVGAAPDTFERLNNLLDDRIKIGQDLAFTDDQVRDSFNYLLAATDDSTEATKRQQAAFDLARGAHIDLGTATKLLGKLSAENVEVFKKMGITIGENATEADALAAVQARFGGQAEAYAKSTAGQFEQTSIRMSELKEQIGAQLLPVMTKIGEVLLTEVVPKLEEFANYWATNVQPKIEAWWNDQAKPVLTAIWTFIQDEVMPRVQENFAKFQDYYDSDIKPALDNIKTAIGEVVQFLIDHWGQIEPFVRPIFIAIQTAAEVALGAIKLAIDILGGDWKGAVEDMKQIWESIMGGFDDYFDAVKDQILVAVGLIKGGFEGIAGAIKGAFFAAVNEIIGLINKAIEAYNKIPLAPNVPTIPPVGGGGSGPPPQGPVYGPAKPIEGPETPPVYERGIFGQSGGAGGGSIDGYFVGTPAWNTLPSGPGGMGMPSSNYVDPRGYTYTAEEILAQRANPPIIQYITIQGSAWALNDLAYELKKLGT